MSWNSSNNSEIWCLISVALSYASYVFAALGEGGEWIASSGSDKTGSRFWAALSVELSTFSTDDGVADIEGEAVEGKDDIDVEAGAVGGLQVS